VLPIFSSVLGPCLGQCPRMITADDGEAGADVEGLRGGVVVAGLQIKRYLAALCGAVFDGGKNAQRAALTLCMRQCCHALDRGEWTIGNCKAA
jgi:hypothetical protein